MLAARLHEALADTPVVLLIGARQAGKSTLAQGLSGDARYITLDDAVTLEAARRDPTAFVDREASPLVIDEVQRAPELLLAVKASVDRDRRPGRFLLTGSADVLLLPRVSESLAGRVEVLTLWPFAQCEIEGTPPTFLDRLLSGDEPSAPGESRAALVDRLLRGGYPEAVQRTEPAARRRWFAAYITTVLQREVRELANLERLTQLPQILAALATRVRGPLNRAAIGSELGIAATTLERYLVLLRHVFLVRPVPAWQANVGRRLAKTPKVLLTDTGLLAHLLELDADRLLRGETALGPLVENFVGMELTRLLDVRDPWPALFHFRTSRGAEVDFLIETRGGRVAGIEVKTASTVRAADFAQLELLRDRLGERFVRGVILYGGAEPVPFGERLAAWPLSALWAP